MYKLVDTETDIDGFEKHKISRYMSFFRFVYLLKHGLYIPNVKQLEDCWEGMLGITHRQKLRDNGEATLRYTAKDYEAIFSWLHVSCWYNSTNESYLMWRAYGGSEEAVMIESSSARLEKLYRESNELFIGYASHVTYHEQDQEPERVKLPSLIAPFGIPRPSFDVSTPDPIDFMPEVFSKYNYYDGEKEFRLVCLNNACQQGSSAEAKEMVLPLGSSQFLIEKVRVSPFASEIVFDTVSLIAESFIPGVPIERSKIEING